MANVATQHGMCGASAHAYGYWGIVLGPVFHRYREGYRSAKLACDLVEKHGFTAYRAKAYRSIGITALWTQRSRPRSISIRRPIAPQAKQGI